MKIDKKIESEILHVAMVMDGNGRWANERALARLKGHAKGADRVRHIVRASLDMRVTHLTLFAFSTENWKRSESEVLGLMSLFKKFMKSEAKKLLINGVKVRFIGDRSKLEVPIIKLMNDLEVMTAENDNLHLSIALNYGGRDEIVRATKKIAEKVKLGQINTDDISAFQFDLEFDNNAMQLRPGHSLTNRVGNHTISTNEIGDNIIRVVVISSTNETINPGTGTVVNLNFTSNNEPGSFDVIFSNLVFSDSSGSEISINPNDNQITILGPKFKLLTTNIDFGRVSRSSNQSRTIQILNEGNETLTILSQNLSSPLSISETFPISIPAGVNFSINLTLDTTESQVISDQTLFETNDTDETRGLQELLVEADIYSVNEIYVGSNSGDLGSSILIPVSINNMDSFTSFQLDISIPSGVEYVQNSVALSGREEDHSISASVINSNTLRVISYSPNNLNFNSTSGEVFSFSLLPVSNSGYHPLDISNSIISNLDLGDVISDVY